MRKVFGGAVALGLAAVGSLVMAGPGSAQEDPGFELSFLEAELSPSQVEVGDEVTVTPTENCSTDEGILFWALFEAGDFSWDDPSGEGASPVLSGDTELAPDGSWEIVFEAPDGSMDDAAFQALAEEEPDPEVIEVYGQLPLTVGDTEYEWVGECFPVDLPEYLTLEAELSPTKVSAGDEVMAMPVDNCSAESGFLDWALFHEGDFNWEDGGTGEPPVLSDFAELAPDGSWEIVFNAPGGSGGEGDQGFGSLGQSAADEGDEDPFVVEVYGPLSLDVDGTAYEWFGICSETGPEPEELEAEITSHENHPDLSFPLVETGEQVIIEPIDACPVTENDEDLLFWEVDLWDPETGDLNLDDAGYLDVTDDGEWKLAIDTDDYGVYVVWLDCENSEDVTGFYNYLQYGVGVVTEKPTEPPTKPAGPKPARPIADDPPYTG
jgi:hypothetical protein